MQPHVELDGNAEEGIHMIPHDLLQVGQSDPIDPATKALCNEDWNDVCSAIWAGHVEWLAKKLWSLCQ